MKTPLYYSFHNQNFTELIHVHLPQTLEINILKQTKVAEANSFRKECNLINTVKYSIL